MTLEKLQENVVRLQRSGYGTYKVEIKYRNQYYRCNTHNTLATDRIKYGSEYPRVEEHGYTLRQALQALYNECKRKNGLDY